MNTLERLAKKQAKTRSSIYLLAGALLAALAALLFTLTFGVTLWPI